MERLSVKKPFTVLVAVIIIIAMGVVSLMHLSMDLLPEISLPYMIVITTYPGAGPEKVEAMVTKPMENALGTVSGVKNVSSTSSDNYSLIQLEFEEDTNLDSAMVKLTSELNQIQGQLPDGVGTPSIMQISMDMVATMYVAVERDGYNIYELSDFVNYEVIPYLSRQEGVASISTIGLVEQTVQVELNQDKIDALNDRILVSTNDALAEAEEQLNEAQEKLNEAQEALDEAESSFGSTMSSAIFGQLDKSAVGAGNNIKASINSLVDMLRSIEPVLANLQASQNASIANAQQSVSDMITLISATQSIGGIVNEETLQNYSDVITSAMDGTSETDYGTLTQNVIAAYIALNEAIATNGAESAEAAAAQAQYDTASAALVAAINSEVGITDEQIAELSAQLETLIGLLENASNNIDDSSVGSLLGSSQELLTALNNISAFLDAISKMDPMGSLSASIASMRTQISSSTSMIDQLPTMIDGMETMFSGLTQGQLDAAVAFSTASVQLSDAQNMLAQAQAQYDTAKEAALKNANVNALLSPATLSGLVYAQNFSMPAGYIDDENDNSWLLKVGDEFDSEEAIAEMILIQNDAIGTVMLQDVADITIIDNAAETYAKLNGSESIILSIYKSSASGTNDVSKACNKAFDEMEDLYDGMHSVTLVDQGVYISMIVESIFSSIALGALLAIIILALFLKDIKPTIVVAISIPLSVLLAIVLMYFTGLDLNMMTLSGLSLGIGMLVDNSVVVMENIFRLRNQGVPAPRAAVQGAKQVKGSIIASTLTTICVFLPAVFASGTVKTLLYPLALSIGYCLVASLAMALTVVPASCSTLLSNAKPKDHKLFDKIQNGYGKTLRWCLKFKVVPLLLAIVLLAISILSLLRTGIVYIPEMTTNEINVTITTPEELTREESYAMVDAVMMDLLEIDGIEELGIMDSGSTASFIGGGFGGSGGYGSYMVYIVAPENITAEEVDEMSKEIEKAAAKHGAEALVAGGGMSDMSSLMGGSGMSISVYGNDLEKLHEIAGEIGDILEDQEGLIEVDDGSEDNEPALHLIIDRDKAMEYGFTVAQIYAQIAQELTVSVTATTVTIDGMDMSIVINNNLDPLTVENILDMEFDSSTTAMGGMSSGSGMSGGMSGMDMSAGFGAFGDDASEEDEDAVNEDEKIEEEETEEEEEETTTVHKLSEFASLEETVSESAIRHENLSRYLTITAATAPGYNTTLVSRELTPKLEKYEKSLPNGYSIDIGGETSQVNEMVSQMVQMAALALLFIYMIMVAQFQSLLSPFIILFTIPLAFTGGMFGLIIADQPLSLLSLLGFVILMGTVVNNGIVFVDYANQLRMGGMERHDALVATGVTRMRPILMTALTTILAMSQLMFGKGMASQLGSGMAIVIAGGLLYATIMTLYIVPVVYDIMFKRQPLKIDVGDDIDEEMDDASEFIAKMKLEKEAEEAKKAAKEAEKAAKVATPVTPATPTPATSAPTTPPSAPRAPKG
ncbi:MAG: efflux RND transporter permease subunit [Saccharofermentans sp.]|nr:efflux RND transporter permease subunit [Saccharofermentans sp.]